MKNNETEFKEFDLAELLDTEEKMIDYLNAELAEGDPHYIKVAIKAIARARNLGDVAQKAGLSKTTVYRALSENSNPKYSTIQKIISALNLHIMVVPNTEISTQG